MNTYTVAIDVAAPSLMKASDAIFLMIKTEATKSTVSECMKMPGSIAIDLDSLRVLPRQASDENPHGKRKEQAQDLPENVRMLTREEAEALWGKTNFLVELDGRLVFASSIGTAQPVLGGNYSVLFSAGSLFFCLPNSDVEQISDARCAKLAKLAEEASEKEVEA